MSINLWQPTINKGEERERTGRGREGRGREGGGGRVGGGREGGKKGRKQGGK